MSLLLTYSKTGLNDGLLLFRQGWFNDDVLRAYFTAQRAGISSRRAILDATLINGISETRAGQHRNRDSESATERDKPIVLGLLILNRE